MHKVITVDCVEIVYVNWVSPRCVQHSFNGRWLNDFYAYQRLSPVLVLSSGNLDRRDYSWNRL